jgi:hypothetical protein
MTKILFFYKKKFFLRKWTTMPGAIPHLITGAALYFMGRYSFRQYFKGDQNTKKRVFLAAVCLIFSLIPDFFLGIYYLTHLEPVKVLMPYQIQTHLLFTPLTIGPLIPIIVIDKKRRPIWIMGAIALLLHILLDYFLIETNFLF